MRAVAFLFGSLRVNQAIANAAVEQTYQPGQERWWSGGVAPAPTSEWRQAVIDAMDAVGALLVRTGGRP